MKLTVSKEFNFSTGHNLKNHKGLCRFIHGHNYKLIITVTTTRDINIDANSSNNGMIIDFSDLNSIVKELIVKKYDHSLLIWDKEYTGIKIVDDMLKTFTDKELKENNIIKVNYRPTAENMCMAIYSELYDLDIFNELSIKLSKIRLYETDTSYAELEIN